MQKEVCLCLSHWIPQFKVWIASNIRKLFLKYPENVSFPHLHCQALIPCDVGATWTISEIFLAIGQVGLKL